MKNEIELKPSKRAKQIIVLARQALDGAEEVKTRTRTAIDQAARVGRLMSQERDAVMAAFGRRAWEPYFEAHFAPVISRRTAYHWMKLSAIALSHKTLDPRRLQIFLRAQIRGESPSPDNTPENIPDAASVTVVTHPSHLGLINRFNAWFHDLSTESKEEIPSDYAAQLLRDFQPIIDFIETLKAKVK